MTGKEKHRLKQRLRDLRSLESRVRSEIAYLELKLEAGSSPRVRRNYLEHGTNAGYTWHVRRKVPFPEDHGGSPCGCRAAHAQLIATYRGRVSA